MSRECGGWGGRVRGPGLDPDPGAAWQGSPEEVTPSLGLVPAWDPFRKKECNAVPGTGSALSRGLRDWGAGIIQGGQAGKG